MGWHLMKLFLRGLVWMPIGEEIHNDVGIIKIADYMIIILRVLMFALILIEVYKLIKNRKAD